MSFKGNQSYISVSTMQCMGRVTTLIQVEVCVWCSFWFVCLVFLIELALVK